VSQPLSWALKLGDLTQQPITEWVPWPRLCGNVLWDQRETRGTSRVVCMFMKDSVPTRICQIKVNYRVKVPLFAFTITDGTPITIPTGAQVEWRPPDAGLPEDELTNVRWLRDDYLVGDEELYQNCERVGSNSSFWKVARERLGS
jgi:hypothetical protein